MKLRTIAIGVAACALAAPATGMGAVAAVQDDRLPVVPISQIEKRLDLAKASGARVARVDLFWSDIAPTKPAKPRDPTDPAYRWERSDRIIEGLLQRNIRPIVAVYSSPRWSSNRPTPRNLGFNPFFPKPADFGAFMEALARRYNGSTTPQYGLYNRPLVVRHFEIWNECNLRRYCLPQFDAVRKPVSPQLYARLVRAAYPAIKRANRRAVVIAGATGPKSTTDKNGIGTMPWLIALRKSRAKFDVYSQHVYPAAPPLSLTKAVPSWGTLPRIIAEVDKIRRGMPIYITEAGYTTKFTKFRPKAKVTESQQRTYLRQIFNLPLVRSKRFPVVVWFNLQDNVFWPGGLLRENLSKKPSHAAFRIIARRGTVPAALRP